MSDKFKNWLVFNHGKAESGRILLKEEILAHKIGKAKIPPVLEFWTASRECFVVGRYYAKKLTERGVLNKLKARVGDIPMIFRSSGGQAILHDGTCLNFGVIVPRSFLSRSFNIREAFTVLCSGVMRYLKNMGILVYSGKVSTFCPGPYDLMVGGRKIAGISLLLRKNFCLVHGTLLVNSEKNYFDKLKVFYPSLDEEAISLARLVGKDMDNQEVTVGIIEGYRESLGVSFELSRLP